MIDLLDPAYHADPHRYLAAAREMGAAAVDKNGIWYALRHKEVSALFKDPRCGRELRNWIGYPLIRPYLADSPLERCIEQWMFSVDGAEHLRLRRLVARLFTPQAVAAMTSAIEAIADELLAPVERATGPVELMAAFAQPFPVRVISRVLGLPLTIYDQLKSWSTDIAWALEPTARRRQKVAANEAAVALMAYLREQVAARAERTDGDLIGVLLAAAEDGDKLTEEELISQLVLLFIAGHETTTNLIGNGLHALCLHPAQWARLRAERSLLPSAIEEMLRYESPANNVARVPTSPVQVGDTTIDAGQLIICMAGAANRDPAVFADPDVFDIGRAPNPHVSFGGGAHYCLGAPLARIEAQVAFTRLLERFERFELVDARWRTLLNLRGLETLQVSPVAAR